MPRIATTAPASVSEIVLYSEDFTIGVSGWHSRFAPGYGGKLSTEGGLDSEKHRLDWHAEEGGFVRSRSGYPHYWQLDGNHACFSPWYSQTGEQPCWGWMMFPFTTRAVFGIDMNGARLNLTLRTEDHLGTSGQLYWINPNALKVWVQGVNPLTSMGVNYVWNSDLISLSGDGWQDRSVLLDPTRATCAGSASIKSNYDCSMTAAEVLESPQNIFLILGPLNIDNIAANGHYPIGQIDLRNISITR